MIAGVKGIIEAIGTSWVIVDVGGVSFQVFLPTSTLATLGTIGQEIKLHTHLHVREDSLMLFGFSSAKELALFETVITVKGIGPKLGLSMLSSMEADQLVMAIAGGDFNLLSTVPGIGKKTAERIVLELKDKIGGSWALTQDLEYVQENGEVVQALTSLGYSVAEATRAVATLPSAKMDLEEKIRLALHYLGEK
ncbi:MAG TPA: Holliday junction branch migration protein RuvA [Dehalococcoidales bacterium]